MYTIEGEAHLYTIKSTMCGFPNLHTVLPEDGDEHSIAARKENVNLQRVNEFLYTINDEDGLWCMSGTNGSQEKSTSLLNIKSCMVNPNSCMLILKNVWFVYVVEDTRMLIIAGVEPFFMYGMYQISIRYLYLFFYCILYTILFSLFSLS